MQETWRAHPAGAARVPAPRGEGRAPWPSLMLPQARANSPHTVWALGQASGWGRGFPSAGWGAQGSES